MYIDQSETQSSSPVIALFDQQGSVVNCNPYAIPGRITGLVRPKYEWHCQESCAETPDYESGELTTTSSLNYRRLMNWVLELNEAGIRFNDNWRFKPCS